MTFENQTLSDLIMHPGIARHMGIIAVVVGYGLAVKNYYSDEPRLAIVSLVAVALTVRFLWRLMAVKRS